MSYRIVRTATVQYPHEYDVEVDGMIYYFAKDSESSRVEQGGPWNPMHDTILRELTGGKYDWLWVVEIIAMGLLGLDISEFKIGGVQCS